MGPHCRAPASHLSDKAPSTSPPISMPAMKIDWASSFSLLDLHTKSHCTGERGGQAAQSSPLSLGPECALPLPVPSLGFP